jgi:hypothetical protein
MARTPADDNMRAAYSLVFIVLIAAVAPCAEAASGASDSASVPAPEASTPGGTTVEPYSRVLPFLADEAIKAWHELPLPFGAGVILTGLDNRKIDVSDVRVGLQNPVQSVSQFVQLGSTSNVFNANFKFDAWLLPFLDVYALAGYVHNESTTDAIVSVPKPGPRPGTITYQTEVSTELDGVVAGGGVALAGGYGPFFLVGDVTYIQSDLGFDDSFKAFIATIRAGWNGRAGSLPMQVWLGVGDWDTHATAKGHATLSNGQILNFEADQGPHTPWIYDVGTNLQFSKRLQLVIDLGGDFQGGWVFVIGPTWRF